MGLLKSLLGKFFDGNRRQTERKPYPNLVAYVWTGGPPEPMTIRDISLRGMFLESPISWYPGTLLRLVIQNKASVAEADEDRDLEGQSISVLGKVAYKDESGYGLEFFPVVMVGSQKQQKQMKEGATKDELENFLRPHVDL
jgi:hypothetical protein